MVKKIIHETLEARVRKIHNISDLLDFVVEIGDIFISNPPSDERFLVYKDGIFVAEEWVNRHEYGWHYVSTISEHFIDLIKRENDGLYKKITATHDALDATKKALNKTLAEQSSTEEGSEQYTKFQLASDSLSQFQHQLQNERRHINHENAQVEKQHVQYNIGREMH
jgi:hypothetical protein